MRRVFLTAWAKVLLLPVEKQGNHLVAIKHSQKDEYPQESNHKFHS